MVDPLGSIAFVKYGPCSHVNESVLQCLQREFPGYSVEEIEVGELVDARDPRVRCAAAADYLQSIVKGQRRLDDCVMRTPYYFNRLRRELLKRLARKPYVFSFQTQSLWDASAPGLPHFVYTDHTHLANLEYPDFAENVSFRIHGSSWKGRSTTTRP